MACLYSWVSILRWEIFYGLNGVLVTQLIGNLQLGHPTQKAVSHIIILSKILIQVTGRYTPLKI